MSQAATPKIAIVCDWLTNMGGAEHFVYSLHKAFPDAPIYTSVFDPIKCPKFKDLEVKTTYLQKLPKFLRFKHQLFPTFRTSAFSRLDLSNFDIVISSSSAEAKAVKVGKNAVHICYCHTPTRYYWSHYKEYLKNPGLGFLNPLAKIVLPLFVNWMRRLDLKSVAGVDYFVANSHEVQARIQRYYKQASTVIFPPVETTRLQPANPVIKGDYYLTVGRQIPYKRTDLTIRACTQLQRKLIVIGNGNEHQRLLDLAGESVEFKTNVDDQQIVDYFQRAKGFIFPGLEDFGIVPVEAMSAGTPVIAYGKGGALDYVIPGKTGLFFKSQTTTALVDAILEFEKQQFSSAELINHAQDFAEAKFISRIQNFVYNHQTKR